MASTVRTEANQCLLFVRPYSKLYKNSPIYFSQQPSFLHFTYEITHFTKRLSNLHNVTQVESRRAGSRTSVLDRKGTKVPLVPKDWIKQLKCLLFCSFFSPISAQPAVMGKQELNYQINTKSGSTKDQNIHKLCHSYV